MSAVFESFVDAVSSSAWTYVIVFIVAMLDAFFPVVPSEATTIAAGVVAGNGGLSVEILILRPRSARSSATTSRSASATSSATARSTASSPARSRRSGCLGAAHAGYARRLHDRRRALHPGQAHGRPSPPGSSRPSPGAASSSTTRSPAAIWGCTRCCSGTWGQDVRGGSLEGAPPRVRDCRRGYWSWWRWCATCGLGGAPPYLSPRSRMPRCATNA